MRSQATFAIAIAALLATASFATAKEWKTVRIGTEGAYAPFNFKDADGNLKGFEIDLGKALCEKMKVECTFVAQDWDGIIPALVAGKYDVIMASMSITDERKQVIDFTDRYYNTPSIIVAAKETDVKIDFKNVDSVKGKIFGVQTSTNNANYLQKYFGTVADIKLYDTQDNVNADLVAGRVDLVMADKIALDSFLKSDQGKDFEVKATAPYDPVLGDGIGGGIRKGDTALKDKLNAAVKALRDNGTYSTIAKKYFDFDIYGSSS